MKLYEREHSKINLEEDSNNKRRLQRLLINYQKFNSLESHKILKEFTSLKKAMAEFDNIQENKIMINEMN